MFANPPDATAEDDQNITSLINGEIDLPIPVYFALGVFPLPDSIIERLKSNGPEVCTNLFFLGKRTTMKTSEGVKIVALGGSFDSNILGVSKDDYLPYFNEDDAKVLQDAKSADLLITSEWPSRIRSGSKVDFKGSNLEGQSCIADLCSVIRPKYHFSTYPDPFYEREPFFHPPTESAAYAYPVTRFISLAAFGENSRGIYAFNLDPHAAPPVTVPTGVTYSPFAFNRKKRPQTAMSYEHHCNKRSRYAPPSVREKCYFCLANNDGDNDVETHLIASIGENAYMTIAKGPLSTARTFPDLGFPGHMLIIPIAHTPTISSLPDPDVRTSTYQEMLKFRRALNSMLSDTATGNLGSVTWEVSRSKVRHVHWQFLPVPIELVHSGKVDALFTTTAQDQELSSFIKGSIGDVGEETNGAPEDFFRVIIWTPDEDASGNGDAGRKENGTGEDVEMEQDGGGTSQREGGRETEMYMPLNDSMRFDLQFGRVVMAKLLDLEDRKYWQRCAQSHEDEVRDVKAFQAAFKPFDDF